MLVCTYVLSAFTTGSGTDAAQLVLYATIAILSLRTSDVPKRHIRLIAAGLVAGSAVMLALSLTLEAGRGIADVWIATQSPRGEVIPPRPKSPTKDERPADGAGDVTGEAFLRKTAALPR